MLGNYKNVDGKTERGKRNDSKSVWRFVESMIMIDDCPYEPLWPVRFKCTGYKTLSVN